MYTPSLSHGYESRKCRYRVLDYTHGLGLDLGCGSEKINMATSIGIDYGTNAANLNIDLSRPNALNIFSDESMDYVFSSHLLEDFYDTENTLKEWWRIIKTGGYLILYLPHKFFYPNIDSDCSARNRSHKHDFIPEEIIDYMNKFAVYKLIRCQSYNEKDEYSFELIFQKTLVPMKKTIEVKPTKKKVIIFRYGAVGDMIQITPLLSVLKKHNYHITVNCTPDTKFILDNNPNVDKLLLQEGDSVPNHELGNYMDYLSKGYDKSINLCESIERHLLYQYRDNKFYDSKKSRGHDINYFDETIKLGGFKETGRNPELYLSDAEKFMLNIFTERNKDYFNIIWALKGSADHKLLAQAQDIMETVVNKYKDIRIYIVSGEDANPLSFKYERIYSMTGIWSQRTSCIMTKVVDLVISPETGVLSASGCFDTPKIGLLSHSNKNNLTKYFKNDYSVQSKAKCSPCHRMHFGPECKRDKDYNLPVCATSFNVNEIMERIDKVYQEKKCLKEVK